MSAKRIGRGLEMVAVSALTLLVAAALSVGNPQSVQASPATPTPIALRALHLDTSATGVAFEQVKMSKKERKAKRQAKKKARKAKREAKKKARK